MAIKLKLDAFEGPLDLLLHLIEKAEIDLYDISIAEITQQYMAALTEMKKLELEIASEFLVMASTLLVMKSEMLLPKPKPELFQPEAEDEEMDPRQQLIQRLVEYKRFKRLAAVLKEREKDRAQVFSRLPADLQAYIPETGAYPTLHATLYDLVEAFRAVMQKKKALPETARIRRDKVSVSDMVVRLRHRLAREEDVLFSKLFDDVMSREVVVATFLALLELIKKREVVCEQSRLFADIVIRRQTAGEVQSISG